MTSTASPYPSASPILSAGQLTSTITASNASLPRTNLRPSPSAPISSSGRASPLLSNRFSLSPSATGQNTPIANGGEEEDELQEDDSPAPTNSTEATALPKLLNRDRERNGSSVPLMSTASTKAPLMTASASASGSTHAPSPRAGLFGGAAGKSRKSSCEMCHHRKIKCDQQRPSCSSCIRKGQACQYSEEAEQTNQSIPPRNSNQHQRAMSVTIVNASDPTIKYTMPVPGTTTPSLKVGYGHGNHPEWKVADSPVGKGSANGSAEKKKSAERRERIVSGFDSDSDVEAEPMTNGNEKGRDGDGAGIHAIRPTAREKPTEKAKDIDGELAALVEGKPAEDVDELDDEPDRDESDGSQEQDRDLKKRGVLLNDDLSGELLELASAPPKKKKKPIAPAVTSASGQSSNHPPAKPYTNRQAGGRTSLSNAVLPLTPVTNASVLSFNRLEQGRFDPYSTPLQNLTNSLPSHEMQTILFTTCFADPFLTEGISLLQPQYMDDFKGLLERRATRLQAGDATTLANAFAFLAVALRILPDETSKLLLASQGYGSSTNQLPRSLYKVIASQPASPNDPTPLYQRYLDLALLSSQIAEQADPPSVMLVMLKLILYRYSMLGHRRDKVVLAGMWLAQAVKIAQALGMGKEWEGLTQGERELRRRVMWSLYIADRHHSFETSFPYTIMDAHQGIHLPSPMAEGDLYKLRPDIRELPAHATEVAPTSCTALFIHTHLARRITPILDSFATISAANTPHDLVLRFDASLDAFQDALPPYFRLFPLTETRFDSTHPYLPAHRVRLHSTLLGYRIGVHRTHLPTYLQPSTPTGIRQVIAQVCLSSLRVQRSAKMLDGKVAFRLFNPMSVFENAATLALIMYVEKAVNASVSRPLDRASSPSMHSSAFSTSTIPPPMSPEYMSMRAGVAEAAELLDNVSVGEGQTFARSAVAVLREVMIRVDAPLKPIAQSPKEEIPKPSVSPDRPTTGDRLEPRFPTIASTSNSPISIDKLTSSTPSKPTIPSVLAPISVPAPSPVIPPVSEPARNPYVHSVTLWLEEMRKGGVNLEVLLREPEWQGGWERIVAGM